MGVKTVFTFTADGPVDGVRMMDEQGWRFPASLPALTPSAPCGR